MNIEVKGGVTGGADAAAAGVAGRVRGILNRGISTAYIADDGWLVLVMTDGQTIRLGEVVGRGIESAHMTSAGNLILTYSDGTTEDVGNIKGVGVKDAYIRPDRHLVLVLTNGTEIDTGSVGDEGIPAEAKEIVVRLHRQSLYLEDMSKDIRRLAELFGQTIPVEKTYSVALNLNNITADHPGGTVSEGSSLVVNLSVNDGYELASITVTMGGANITSSVADLSRMRIEIPRVGGDVVITAAAVAAGPVIHTVTLNLTGFTADRETVSTVNDGDGYRCYLTPEYGYKLDGSSVRIMMGDADITTSSFNSGTINIAGVTADVTITAKAAAIVRYTVTKSLVGHSISNDVSEVFEGQSYSAKLTMLDGYKNPFVKILMGGVNITEGAYKDGVVYISAVTGNIVVSALAEELEIYPVAYNLFDTESSNQAEAVRETDPYETDLTAPSGFSLTEVKVKMGGTDVTSSVYDSGAVRIPGATGAIVIEAVSYPDRRVTKNLVGCSSTNQATYVPHGSSYQCVVSPRSGYVLNVLTVTMGEVDITQEVVSVMALGDAKINIPYVDGDIVITAEAYPDENGYFSITVNTSFCDCTVSDGDYVGYGQPLSGEFIPEDGATMQGAEVTITMGNADITMMVYDANTHKFYIPSVTGELTIVARAWLLVES